MCLHINLTHFDFCALSAIGDAYMCAGNLVTPQEDDHCKRVAEFAIDAVNAAKTTLIRDGKLRIAPWTGRNLTNQLVWRDKLLSAVRAVNSDRHNRMQLARLRIFSADPTPKSADRRTDPGTATVHLET